MSKEVKIILTSWLICLILFAVAGCDCEHQQPLFKTGEIVYHALDPDLEFPYVVLRNDSKYEPKYKVRGTEAFFDPEWMYEGELRDKEGKQRIRRKKKK
jgi:hypothetical protein